MSPEIPMAPPRTDERGGPFRSGGPAVSIEPLRLIVSGAILLALLIGGAIVWRSGSAESVARRLRERETREFMTDLHIRLAESDAQLDLDAARARNARPEEIRVYERRLEQAIEARLEREEDGRAR